MVGNKPKEAVLAQLKDDIQFVREMLEEFGPLGGLKKLEHMLDEKLELLSIEGLPLGAYFIDRKEAVPEEGKPYPNEHSCRLKDPDKYDRFARKNCWRRSNGKCIDYIFGIKGNKAEVQAMRYKITSWTAAAAKAHCKRANGMFEAASGKDECVECDFTEANEAKTTYNCECIKCGKKVKASKKHCKDIKCPKCGGAMRREERPGSGR